MYVGGSYNPAEDIRFVSHHAVTSLKVLVVEADVGCHHALYVVANESISLVTRQAW